MRCDMDLIRAILLNTESSSSDSSVDGFSEDELKYHQALAIEADLLKGNILVDLDEDTEIPSAVHIQALTWAGHDFIDAIREDTKWMKVKNYLTEAGKQITIETVKSAIKSLFG